jgi:hypothetical protein
MADPPHEGDPEPLRDEVVVERGGSDAGMPRWVKVSLIVGLALVLLFVLAQVTGLAGDHGPGRHGPGSHGPGNHGAGSDTQSSVIHEGAGHNPPVVHHS